MTTWRGNVAFFVLRYLLVPMDVQLDFTAKDLPTPKGRAVVRALEGHPRTFGYYNRDYVLVGFEALARGSVESSRFYVGQLARHKSVGIHELTETQIVERSTDDWTPLWVCVDVETQRLLVERNTSFGSLNLVVNVLEAGLRTPIERDYKHRLVIEPVTRRATFWEVVEDNPYVYDVGLTLFSPNLLDAPESVRSALQDLKQAFNQDQLGIDLSNSRGELDLDTGRDTLDPLVAYVGEGEGRWEISASTEEGGPRRRFKSKDYVETVDLDVPHANRSTEEQYRDVKARIFSLLRDLF